MNRGSEHPSGERLSSWLDGEGTADERRELERHLAGCAVCSLEAQDLRRILAAARALEPGAPPEDLWPAIARRLGERPSRARRPAWLAPLAAALLASGLTWALLERGASRTGPAGTYLLLLYEAAEPAHSAAGEDPAAVAARYGRWAQELGGHCLGGEELAEGGYALRPGEAPAAVAESAGRIGGYFLIAAESPAEAVELARSCPHLERGGWIELRPIQVR